MMPMWQSKATWQWSGGGQIYNQTKWRVLEQQIYNKAVFLKTPTNLKLIDDKNVVSLYLDNKDGLTELSWKIWFKKEKSDKKSSDFLLSWMNHALTGLHKILESQGMQRRRRPPLSHTFGMGLPPLKPWHGSYMSLYSRNCTCANLKRIFISQV